MEDRLDSWKEIAEYLHSTVRTVQRWEKAEGLPILRHQHRSGASIYASRSEIDSWLDRRTPPTGSEPAESQRMTPRREDLWLRELENARTSLRSTLISTSPTITDLPQNSVPIGREAEFEQLLTTFSDCAERDIRMLCIAGEPGIGKTTLLNAFLATASAREGGCFPARGACSERLVGSEAYLPVLDALERLIEGPEGSEIGELLRLIAPTWYIKIAPLWSQEDESLAAIAAEASGASSARLKRELATFFRELSRFRPTLLVIDDVHWADASTIDTLTYLSRHHELGSLLILIAFRRSELLLSDHPLLSVKRELQEQGVCREINLGLLTRDDVGRYLDGRFPSNDFDASLADSIYEQTEGNPLFMVGLIDELERGDQLIERAGVYSLAIEIATFAADLPESVRGMIDRKIGRLDEIERSILDVASVQGSTFDSAIVARALEIEPEIAERKLTELERVHAIIRRRIEVDHKGQGLTEPYLFEHILYQNMLYEELPRTRRARMALRVADALTAEHGRARSPGLSTELAILFETARHFDRAADHFLEASRDTSCHETNLEAVTLGLRSIQNAEQLDGKKRWERIFDAAMHVADLNFRLAHFEHSVRKFELAELAAEALGDAGKQVDALCGLSSTWFYQRELDRARDIAQRAHRIATESNSDIAIATADSVLARDLLCTGDLYQAEDHFQRALPVLQAHNDPGRALEPVAFNILLHGWRSEWKQASTATRWWLDRMADRNFPTSQMHFFRGMALGNQGFITDALAILREGQRLGRLNDDVYYISRIPNTEAWLMREIGDHEAAIRLNEESIEIARRSSFYEEPEANAHVNLGEVLMDLGELDRAYTHLVKAKELFGVDVWFRWRYNMRLEAGLSRYFLLKGDVRNAKQHGETALELAIQPNSRKHIARSLALLGEVAIREDRSDDANRFYEEAVATIEHHPCPTVQWRILAGASKVATATKSTDKAEGLRSRAATTLSELANLIEDEQDRERFLSQEEARRLLV